MSLQLGNRTARDNLYTILVNLIGGAPILILIAIYTAPPIQTFLYSIVVILFLPVAVYDIVSKMENKNVMLISIITTSIGILGIFGLIFTYNSLFYSFTVASILLTAFLLHPVENSSDRIADVKARYGTPGYMNPIILKNPQFKSDTLAPVDLGIVGRDSFFKYLFSDYYTLKQSSHPLVFFTFVLTTVVQILVQQYPHPLYLFHLSTLFVGTYILGLGLKILFALLYSPEDLAKEIKERLEYNLKKNKVRKILFKPALYTIFVGAFITIIGMGIPLPDNITPSGRLVNITEPSTDFLFPLLVIPIIMIIYSMTSLWRKYVWSHLKPIQREKKIEEKGQRKKKRPKKE